ncbi:MAG TPA: hypothetical protein VIL65_03215 [Beijerinckiaceae bacterium]|jgi:hypothetical protein
MRIPIAFLLVLAAGPVAAETDALPPITVRPSGIEDEGTASRARQEDLMRRRDRDFAFRWICQACSGEVNRPSGTPDLPLNAITASPRQ